MLKYKQIWHEIKSTGWLIKFNLTGSTYSSVIGSPEEGRGGGVTPEEDSSLGRLELALILSSSLPKEGDTYRSYNVYRFRSRKLL